MGMEVEFDFEVPPVEDYSKQLCQQVESNIESCKREERVQKKRRELRERIKIQIVTSPYTMTPRDSVIDSNRRDSMTLPHERGSFTPFQKVPFRRHARDSFADLNYNRNAFELESPRTKSAEGLTVTSGEQNDSARSSLLSDSTSRIDNETYASSAESISSHSSFSAVCSPPTKSVSPTMGSQPSSKSMFANDKDGDERSLSPTQLTVRSNAFVTAVSKREMSRRLGYNARQLKDTVIPADLNKNSGKEHSRSISIPEGAEYIQAEFFWVVDYRGTEKTFDSDAFTFAGTRFRLTFSPNSSSVTSKSTGYCFLLALAQSHGHAYVACEFSVHGLLRPTFCRKCTRNLHFTPRSSVYRGYKHFMGPELLSYLENGTFTFSILMKTYIGTHGELLGLPNPLGGILQIGKKIARGRDKGMEGKEKEGDDNDSEIASHTSTLEEEYRMDDIYPKQADMTYFRGLGKNRDISNVHRHNDIIGNNTQDGESERSRISNNEISYSTDGIQYKSNIIDMVKKEKYNGSEATDNFVNVFRNNNIGRNKLDPVANKMIKYKVNNTKHTNKSTQQNITSNDDKHYFSSDSIDPYTKTNNYGHIFTDARSSTTINEKNMNTSGTILTQGLASPAQDIREKTRGRYLAQNSSSISHSYFS